jgi:hypothetical protein
MIDRDGDDGEGDAHQRMIEQSKYLGGDLEHTHLVKGLDFALMNKVRSEMEEEKKIRQEEEEKESLSAHSTIFTSAKQFVSTSAISDGIVVVILTPYPIYQSHYNERRSRSNSSKDQ